MLRVAQNKDEIIIREMPVAEWFSSCLAALLLFGFVFEISSKNGYSGLAWSLGIIAVMIVIFGFQLKNPVTTIKINRPGKTVSVRKQSLIAYSFNVYSFDEISNFIYIEVTGGRKSDDATAYQLIMPMKDGRKIALSTSSGSKDKEFSDAVELINSYIFGTSGQIPFKVSGFNID